MTIREQLDAHVKGRYGIDPEILSFSKEDYGVYRHPDTGRWIAVFKEQTNASAEEGMSGA